MEITLGKALVLGIVITGGIIAFFRIMYQKYIVKNKDFQ